VGLHTGGLRHTGDARGAARVDRAALDGSDRGPHARSGRTDAESARAVAVRELGSCAGDARAGAVRIGHDERCRPSGDDRSDDSRAAACGDRAASGDRCPHADRSA